MLIIRLRRTGKKNKPTYRVVVAEHSFPVNGRFTADLGFYNPHTKVNGLKLDEVKQWLDKGAKPSNTVARLLEREKISHNSVVVVKKNKAPKKAQEEKAPTTASAPASVEVDATEAPTSEETAELPTETTEAASEGDTAEETETAATDEPAKDATPEA